MPRLPHPQSLISFSFSRAAVKQSPAILRRFFHPEPRSFISSAHGTHRFIYRWTIQAILTPFAVAYVCESIANRSDGDGSSWKLDLPDIDTGLLVDPMKMKGQVWGTMRG